jgi:Flp pilus assembly pilin Flp
MKDILQLTRWLKDENGQALAEFALILTFIAAVCVLALTALGFGVLVPLGDFTDGFS